LAGDWLELRTEELTSETRQIGDDLVEGKSELLPELRRLVASSVSLLTLKFKYLRVLPWLFVKATEKTAAALILDQWASLPRDQHDPLTVKLMLEFEDDIGLVAAGEEASPRLRRAVAAYRNTPCDEGPGEGYHRSTSYEAGRSRRATSEWIKASTRLRQSLRKIQAFGRRPKSAGRKVVNFEFTRFKRLLQTKIRNKPSRRWKPVRMSPKKFFERVYRQDDMANDSFHDVAGHQRSDDEARADARAKERLRIEYLSEVLRPGGHYSIPPGPAPAAAPQAPAGLASAPSEEPAEYFFSIIRRHDSRHRPKTIRISSAQADPAFDAPLAVEVQPWSQWGESRGQGHSRAISAFEEGEPEWMDALDIAPFLALSQRLQRWDTRGSEEDDGTTEWHNPRTAQPRIPLMDERCPTLILVRALSDAGWVFLEDGCIHMAGVPLVCDSRGDTSAKFYFQVCLQLNRLLPLCARIPSGQIQEFYKALLGGHAVEPGRSAAHYAAVRAGRAIPLEDARRPRRAPISRGPSVPGLVILDAAGQQIVLPERRPRARPEPKHAPAPGPGGEGGGGPLPLPPPPPIHEPPLPPVDTGAGGSGDGALVMLPPPPPDPGLASSRDWQPCIGGYGKIVRQVCEPPGSRPVTTWLVYCPAHKHVKRRRITDASTRHHGLMEPPAWCHVWLAAGQSAAHDKRTHRDHEPQDADIAAWVRDHGAAFNDMYPGGVA